MMDAVTPTEMPTMDDPEAFAVAFVQAAVDLYKTAGSDAAIAYYNDPANIDGPWYVFIADETISTPHTHWYRNSSVGI